MERARRVLQLAVIAASAALAAVCILLAFLVESAPFEVSLTVSSIALLAASTAAASALFFAMLGLAQRWLERES